MSASYNVTFSYQSRTLDCVMVVTGTSIDSFFYNGDDKRLVGGSYDSGTNLISAVILRSSVDFPEMNTFLGISGFYSNYSVSSDSSTTGSITPGFDTPITGIGFSITESPCFNEGTKILCLNNKEEEYVPIENLRAGDIVKTYHYGYRKIELIGKNCLINHPDHKFTSSMYKMEKTETNGLIEDLIVTGGHSILVDDLG